MDSLPENVHVSNHPVLKTKLTKLRDAKGSPHLFREVLKEVTMFLGYEATESLNTEPHAIETPLAPFEGCSISENVAIVPIMRAGLGMVDSLLNLLPSAEVFHIGMYKPKGSDLPVQYYNRLSVNASFDRAIILDPMVASASTLIAVVDIVKRWCNPHITIISAIASVPGIQNLLSSHPDVELFVGDVDEVLEDGMVVPGFGDAGDRLFGTDKDRVKKDIATPRSPNKKRRLSELEEEEKEG
jgi:uracil phosphoribosyltransferase